MNQKKEKIEIGYDANRGVFVDSDNQVYGAQEYIDAHLGHMIFDDFDIKKIKGYQAQDFIFSNRRNEYHIYVDDQDIDMINLLTSYQKRNGRLKIRTSKNVKSKLKRGYVIAGIVSTVVMSGIAYAAGSGMIGDTVDNVETYMEEVQADKKDSAQRAKVAPILNYFIQQRNDMLENGTLANPKNDAYNRSDEGLYDLAVQVYEELEVVYNEEAMNQIINGGVLTEAGQSLITEYMSSMKTAAVNNEIATGRQM